MMHLDQLSPEEVVKLELGTAVPIVYEIDEQGIVQSKEVLSA